MTQYIFRPWMVIPPSPERPSRIGVCGSGGEDIYDAPLTNETEAKANLIAAAPDILDALKAIVAAFDYFGNGGVDSDTVAMGRAAIAKAERSAQ